MKNGVLNATSALVMGMTVFSAPSRSGELPDFDKLSQMIDRSLSGDTLMSKAGAGWARHAAPVDIDNPAFDLDAADEDLVLDPDEDMFEPAAAVAADDGVYLCGDFGDVRHVAKFGYVDLNNYGSGSTNKPRFAYMAMCDVYKMDMPVLFGNPSAVVFSGGIGFKGGASYETTHARTGEAINNNIGDTFTLAGNLRWQNAVRVPGIVTVSPYFEVGFDADEIIGRNNTITKANGDEILDYRLMRELSQESGVNVQILDWDPVFSVGYYTQSQERISPMVDVKHPYQRENGPRFGVSVTTDQAQKHVQKAMDGLGSLFGSGR